MDGWMVPIPFYWRLGPKPSAAFDGLLQGSDRCALVSSRGTWPVPLLMCRAIECFKVAIDIQPHDSTFIQLGKVGGQEHGEGLEINGQEIERDGSSSARTAFSSSWARWRSQEQGVGGKGSFGATCLLSSRNRGEG